MNQDRGTIKWNALMLPEHVKLLREWKAEDLVKEKPQIENWQFEEMNMVLCKAIEQHATVMAKVWVNNDVKIITSKIARYNRSNATLFFSTGEIVKIADVLHVEYECFE